MINYQINVKLNFCSFLSFCNSNGMLRYRYAFSLIFFKSYHIGCKSPSIKSTISANEYHDFCKSSYHF